ncbi:glutamate receptor ionotropic, kainate 2-like [Lineus longissimus]|uniref:glutamate receptor ionotropic, kainate 2-like n=1 Tax=Lineus longissimus TaxID=88925 RepID=UPI002B4D3002
MLQQPVLMKPATWSWIIPLIYLSLLQTIGGLPPSIKIGLLYEHGNADVELAFKSATNRINSRRDILQGTRLEPVTAQIPAQDSFKASKKLCHMLQEGVAAIFGPKSGLPSAHVQSICDSMDIPHIEAKWGYQVLMEYYAINMYPHYTTLSRAFKEAVDVMDWRTFTVLYETNDGLIRLQELVNAQQGKNRQITIRKLEGKNNDYRHIFKEMKKENEYKIILDCSTDMIETVLRQALSVNAMTGDHHYLITSLDLGLVDMDLFAYTPANITSYRIVDPRNPIVVDVISHWLMQETRAPKSTPLWGKNTIRTEVALIYDAVYLFARALHDIGSTAQNIVPQQLSCRKSESWDHGSSLINYVKMTQIDGMSGKVQFDSRGLRSDFDLQLTEVHTNGSLVSMGDWSLRTGLNITHFYTDMDTKATIALANNTLRVTTILDEPFVMMAEQPKDGTLTGNARFNGYCIDLLERIASIIPNFRYDIHLVEDGSYGSPEDTDQPMTSPWNGMVGELMNDKADLAVASLTITYIREQVIDFTKPYMNLGISIIFKRPEGKESNLFSFLSPLSFEVWLYVIAAYAVVSVTLFVLARFSPYEWVNPHPCNPETDELENQFSLVNSLWFTIGSLMQQGCEIAPRAMSTRIISCIWWFFTLIMISSYTANLAAFLTVERMVSPITSAKDLSKQTDIHYGTVKSGSTLTFFQTSHIATYARMWNFMKKHRDTVFVNSTKEGIKRVREGNYAYLLESTMNEYFVQRYCDLMQVGGLIDSKGYGIGTKRGSIFRDRLSNAILKLQEDQEMHRLYDKWWREKGSSGCDSKDSKEANSLGVGNVGGVFVVLLVGMACSVLVAIFEFIWKARKNADEDKQSLCSEMAEEIRFAVRCGGSSKKPAIKPPKSRREADELFEHGINNGLTNYHTQFGGLMPGDTPLQMRSLYA